MSKYKRVHIVYLVSRLRRQGPFFQLYNIIKYLDRKKFYPRVITLSPETSDSLMATFKKIGVDCNSLGLSRMTDMIFGPRRVKNLLRETPADLIHVSGLRSTILCANHLTGIPRLVSCRQAFRSLHYVLSGETWLTSLMKPKIFSMACRKFDRIVAISNYVRDSARGRLAGRIEVVYNGVDQDIYKPVNETQKTYLRSRLALPQDKRIFLSVGFLSKRKDPLTVIKGFLKSKASQTGILILLGDGSLREKCSRLGSQTNNIHIVGFVENVRDYLGASDIFISASLTEGCPNAVIEALACGLPVILSDIPAHREILAFKEQAGAVFNVGDVASLSEMFSKINDLKYSVRSQAALSIVSNNLSARDMSLKYQQIYTQLHNENS